MILKIITEKIKYYVSECHLLYNSWKPHALFAVSTWQVAGWICNWEWEENKPSSMLICLSAMITEQGSWHLFWLHRWWISVWQHTGFCSFSRKNKCITKRKLWVQRTQDINFSRNSHPYEDISDFTLLIGYIMM